MKRFQLTMLALAASVGISLAAQTQVRGAPIVYEGFDYPAAANGLNSKNGGTGFSGAYAATNNADVLAGTFNYTDSGGKQLQTSGNRAFMDSTSINGTTPPEPTGVSIAPIRNISAIPGTPSTIYLSFLGKQTAGTDRDLTVSLFAAGNGTFGTAERLSVGHGNGFTGWGAYALAVGTNGAHTAIPATDLSLLVARVDLNDNGANERFRIYVNPTLDAEPLVADVDINAYNFIDTIGEITRLRMRAGGSNATQTASQAEFDELRLGLSYADVTPVAVPEPACAMLAAVGAGLLALRRRR